jgi:hypothetical protein
VDELEPDELVDELDEGAAEAEEVPEAPTAGATAVVALVLKFSSRTRPATVLSRVRMARRIRGGCLLEKRMRA